MNITSVAKRIEKNYDEVDGYHLVFNGAKRNKHDKLFLIFLLLTALPALLVIKDEYSSFAAIYMICFWSLLPLSFFYLRINRYFFLKTRFRSG
jgi:hypothetical protein